MNAPIVIHFSSVKPNNETQQSPLGQATISRAYSNRALPRPSRAPRKRRSGPRVDE